MHIFFIFSYFICILQLTCSFNLDTVSKMITLKPPLYTAFEGANYPPSFFGYQIKVNSDSNLVVGAPKFVDPSRVQLQFSSFYPQAKGDILQCPINPSSSSPDRICRSTAQPPSSALNDSFGLSLSVTPQGQTIACSPTKIQSCRIEQHSPGYCYRSNQGSRSWRPDPRTRNESCRSAFLDLIFLLDASGSIVDNDFTIVKDWVKQVADNFRISDGSTRLGVIRYSHYDSSRPLNKQFFINTEIPLGSIKNRQNFNERVDQIKPTQFRTFTSHALNKSTFDFMQSDGFSQRNTAKVLVLLTDGRSTDADYLESSANYVRSLGITTFAVGVGQADIDELRTIATGGPTDERVFNVTNFSLLSGIAGRLGSDIRRSAALEGVSSRTNTTTVNLEYAEYGFSIQSSKTRVSLSIKLVVYCPVYCFVSMPFVPTSMLRSDKNIKNSGENSVFATRQSTLYRQIEFEQKIFCRAHSVKNEKLNDKLRS